MRVRPGKPTLRDKSHASRQTEALRAEGARLPSVVAGRLEETVACRRVPATRTFDSLQTTWVTAAEADGRGCN